MKDDTLGYALSTAIVNPKGGGHLFPVFGNVYRLITLCACQPGCVSLQICDVAAPEEHRTGAVSKMVYQLSYYSGLYPALTS